MPAKQRQELRSAIAMHRETVNRQRSAPERGEQLALPRLCVMVPGELETAEKELLLEASG
ncbi:MAG TPA: hypothetical protein VLZ30_08600 [Verrucomicrobiae bacterium]|nr:hypothetical protein [Verrucomicrobiae bacterium]